MIYLGPHVSISKSIALAPERAHSLGATGFALYTKNEKRWTAPPLSEENCNEFKANLAKYGYTPECVLPHASYIINLASPNDETREKGFECFVTEMKRTEELGLTMLNFHPGSHLKTDIKEACKRIATALDIVIESGINVTPVLENAAGQGSNIGGPFEELKWIIEYSRYPERLGITIDTCHAFAYGYETEAMWDELFSLVPHSTLKGIHLNNSMYDKGSKKDRHAPICDGFIPSESLKKLVHDKRFDSIPIILETPKPELWADEIKYLLED